MIARVHVQDLPGDAARHGRQHERRRLADFFNRDGAAQRRVIFVPLQDIAEVADAGRGQRLDRASGDGVDADLLLAKVGGQIAHAGFQRGFGDAHDVVMGHPFFGAIIGQRQQRSAVAHQLLGALGDSREGIAGDQQRFGEIGLARLDIASGQLVLVGEGDAMDDEINRTPELCGLIEHRVDGGGVGHVAMAQHMGAKALRERAHALLQRIPLIGEGEFCALVMGRLGDPPCNGAIVRHAKHKAAFSSQNSCGRGVGYRHSHRACPSRAETAAPWRALSAV